MIQASIPVLHVSHSREARAFYCDQLGFKLEFEWRPSERDEPCYFGVSRDGQWIHLSSFSGDGVAGNVVMLVVDDVDAYHHELRAKGVTIDSGPVDQDWGNREMYVKDMDGNTLRYTQVLA